MTNYSFHRYANLFPMMQQEEFDSLVADISEKGLLEPIFLFQEQILDGRNRYNACKKIGIGVKTKEFQGTEEDALNAVLSWNLERRHLSSFQKACIATDVLPEFERLAKERQLRTKENREKASFVPEKIPEQDFQKNKSGMESRELAAAQLGTNPRYVSDAKKLEQTAPDVFQAARSGYLNASQAKEVARLPEPARQKVIQTVQQAPQNKRFSTVKTAVQEAKKETPAAPFEFWSETEIERKTIVEQGGTVVANQKTDTNLIRWAENNGLYVRVDRYSDWGNPFLLPQDGDRDEVCDWFEEYFGHKRSLHKRITGELKGKVLGCWCYPERCHADFLAKGASK